MKTVKEWLMELPDGYRERALSQCVGFDDFTPDTVCDSMWQAVERFNKWPMTNEGATFWWQVYTHYKTLRHGLPALPQQSRRERIKKRIEEVNALHAETKKEYNGLGQREMLSGTGTTLQKQMNQCVGIVDALQWVLDNIDLNDDDNTQL